jgi:hypothetical protein
MHLTDTAVTGTYPAAPIFKRRFAPAELVAELLAVAATNVLLGEML